MANIDLNNYETVDDRIQRFYEKHPTGRILTTIADMKGEVGSTRWVVQARVYRTDEPGRAPDATGYAFEIDGVGMTQRAAALETGETSAIGRALANLGFSGNKARASQSEMRKALITDLTMSAKGAQDLQTLAKITDYAKKQGVWELVGPVVYERREQLTRTQQSTQQSTPGGRPREELESLLGNPELTIEDLRGLWKEAKQAGYEDLCTEITTRVNTMSSEEAGSE